MTATDPVLTVTPDSLPGGPLSDDVREDARRLFMRHGFLQIDGVLAPDFVQSLHDELLRRREAGAGATLDVGDRRSMTSVDLDGVFNDPLLYANPRVYPIVDTLLGGKTSLASVGCVTALPGAAAQHRHQDHPPLFPETTLSAILPCYAITLIVPLVNVGPGAGGTAVWLGSHHDMSGVALRDEDAYVPDARIGSVYLMDYRLTHHGTANTLGRIRPILSLVYARPWFADSVNFRSVERVSIPRAARAAVPDRWRHLFAPVREQD